MIELDERLRVSLARQGDVGSRSMPPEIARRIRRRRTFAAAGAWGVVTAFVAVAVVATQVVKSVSEPAPTHVSEASLLEQTPEGWPVVHLVDSPSAIVAGTVDDVSFSLEALPDTSEKSPCVRLTLSDEGRTGSEVACAGDHPAPVSAQADLSYVLARGDLPGDVLAMFGFVSDRVARVYPYPEPSDVSAAILDGPSGWQVRPYLMFPPATLQGWLEAEDSSGRPLAEVNLCAEGISLSACDSFVYQGAPTAEYMPPPPGYVPRLPRYWDIVDPLRIPQYEGDRFVDVSFGGDFNPYVDIVDSNRGVDGKKWVLTYGTVSGRRFSLTAYEGNGRDDTSVGPCAELFFGWTAPPDDPEDLGSYEGGSGFCANGGPDAVPERRDMMLVEDQPAWAPTDDRFQVWYGVVSDTVDHVLVRLDDGREQTVSVLTGLDGQNVRFVLFFTPPGTTGQSFAIGTDGNRLQATPLCTGSSGGVRICFKE